MPRKLCAIIATVTFAVLAQPFATSASGKDEFTIRSETLFPVHDYIYVGDNGPACTDQNANMLRYRSDRTLDVCTGQDKGWMPMHVLPKADAQ